MAFRIVIDWDLCESLQDCEKVAPELFRVNEKNTLDVLQERPVEALRKKAEEAVRKCPRGAISLAEGEA